MVVCFSEAFLGRLAGIASRVEAEVAAAGVPSEPFLRATLRPSAAAVGDAALPAREALDDLYRRRSLAFAHVVQFLAGRRRRGSTEDLGDEELTGLAREAVAACDRWDEDEPGEDWPGAALRRLLAAHHDLGEQIADAEDEATETSERDERAPVPDRHLSGAGRTGQHDPLDSALADLREARYWLERLSTAPSHHIARIGRNVERAYRALLAAAGAMDEAARARLYRRIGELLPQKEEAAERPGEPSETASRW